MTYLYGPDTPLAVLIADPAAGPEGTRFGEQARALWEPLLAAETVGAV